MTGPIIVIGGRGHAKVVIEALLRDGAEVIGFADPTPLEDPVLGIPLLGGDEAVETHAAGSVVLANGVGSVGDTTARRAAFDRFRDRGYRFATVVHPSAVIAPDVVLGEGAQVMAGAVVQPGCRIGANAVVNTGARVDHDCHIGDHAQVSPGAVLCGLVTVGAGAHIGAGAVVIQRTAIADGALVAAGAAVVAGVAAGARVMGVPARETAP